MTNITNMAYIGINLAFIKGLPAEHFRYYGKPMPASYAITWCMLATGFSRIFTKDDLREFLFRLPISLNSMGLVETWLEKDRLMAYRVNRTEYFLTLQDVIMHFGLEVTDSYKNSSDLVTYLNSVSSNLSSAVFIGTVGDFSVIEPEKGEDDEIIIHSKKNAPSITPELIAKAEFFASDLMKFIPEETFSERNALICEKEKQIEARMEAINNLPVFDIENIHSHIKDQCLYTMFNKEFADKCSKDKELSDKKARPLIYLAWLLANDLIIQAGLETSEREGVKLNYDDYELPGGGYDLSKTIEDYHLEELTEYLKIGSFWEEKRSSLDMQGLFLLFVCKDNGTLSMSGENLWESLNWNARSAGIDENSRIRVNPELIGLSDVIFVMDESQSGFLRKNFAYCLGNRQIFVLDINGNFSFMQPELIKLLKARVESYLENLPPLEF